ncbi:hypothetical protein [Pseudoalteromonas luteoviolacea]|uniref:hypothetical protein n=1 Tax=Pseudoalteromonas luteoviolacea TaxID=43657 RepID=UPI0007B08476|nr:hypothetical protein [Pseudoalteromonas luteoviolacea]KZN71440.1 hypothetical protein N477_03965 [Pseudoalteromonas luteoviolacea H33-S]MBQ4876796.1 hypothetical protein [Pseudoalteromonas luteoviolacea]MBQ4905415.1 hypothetical protein [Pseudoalteromonas luteoviolacea]
MYSILQHLKGGLSKEVSLTLLTQFFSLFTPLLLMLYIVQGYGKSEVVVFEAILSVTAFIAILVDYGTSTFYSFRNFNKKAAAKVATTLFVLKLFVSLVGGIIGAVIFYLFDFDLFVLAISILVLLVSSFEIPYIYFANNKTHVFSFIQSLKYPFCVLFIFVTDELYLSLVLSFVFVAFINLVYASKWFSFNFFFSYRIFGYTLSKYRTYTLTELLTGIFSQLDGFIASELLPKEQAFLYVFLRKFVRASNALLNYVYRIAFTRKMKGENTNDSLTSFLLIINLFGAVSFFILSWFLKSYYSELHTYTSFEYYFVVFLQSSLLLVGCLKVLTRNNKLYTKYLFSIHFKATFISAISFCIPIYFFSSYLDAILLSFFRLFADVLYIIVVFLCLKFGKVAKS